jgi:hypothetical protein
MTGWTEEGLLRSWRALAAPQDEAEWRIVRMADFGQLSVDAGCRFPGASEALLVAFPTPWVGEPASLPQGNGFEAELVADEDRFGGRTAVAVVRSDTGAIDIFAVMIVDLLRFLETAGPSAGPATFSRFIGRLREWQDFMARKPRPLSPEAQVGLYGELWMLERLLDVLPPSAAFESWKGPLSAAQDFHVGAGAFEVKSTAGRDGFTARINSIDQLDSERRPMHLCALRFEEQDGGRSLSQLVEVLRAAASAAGRSKAFDAMLILAGYHDEHAVHYGRLLELVEMRILRVDDSFPCLRRATLPVQILQAQYTLDIQSLPGDDIGFDGLLLNLGAVQHEY